MATAEQRRAWFSLGRVFSRAIGSFRQLSGLSLMAIGLFTVAPEALSALLLSQMDESDRGGVEGGLNIVLAVLGMVGQVAVIHAALERQQGRAVTLSSSLSMGGRLLAPALGIGILTGLGILVGLVLLVAPGLYLAIIWSVSLPARIAEGPGVTRAMGSSSELTEGVRWQVLAYLLLLGIVVFGGMFGLAFFVETAVKDLYVAATIVVYPLLSGIVVLILSFATASLYHELRWGPEQGQDETAQIFD